MKNLVILLSCLEGALLQNSGYDQFANTAQSELNKPDKDVVDLSEHWLSHKSLSDHIRLKSSVQVEIQQEPKNQTLFMLPWLLKPAVMETNFGKSSASIPEPEPEVNKTLIDLPDLLKSDSVKIYSKWSKFDDIFTGQKCETEPLLKQPSCPTHLFSRYPSIDGTCNNRIDARRGKSKFPLKRLLPAAYDDDGSSDRKSFLGNSLPLARFLSTSLQGRTQQSKLNHMFTQWGQFITHDMVHSPEIKRKTDSGMEAPITDCSCDSNRPECKIIPMISLKKKF